MELEHNQVLTEKEYNKMHKAQLKENKIISAYMRSLALKSRAVVAKKYAVEGGKNSLYSAMAKSRWAKQKSK